MSDQMSPPVAETDGLPPYLASALEAFDAWATMLGERDFAAQAVKIGDRAPDFALPEARGGTVDLTDLLREGPVVLAFYRGAWCPFCNLQLRAYQEALPKFRKRGASLVAISPQTPDHSLSMTEKEGLAFAVASDAGSATAEAYGVAFTVDDSMRDAFRAFGTDLPSFNGDASWRLPVPATFVIGRDGTVLFARVEGDYRMRTEAADLLAALDAAV